MKKRFVFLVLLIATTLPLTSFADSSTLTASIRIGLTFEDDGTTDEFFFRNFGSRLIWNGTKDLDNGWTGIGYAEFGLNPDDNSRGSSGIDRTRQLWAGLKGGFGTFGPAQLTLTHQEADNDFAQTTDDVTHTTLAGSLGSVYAVYNITNNGSSNDPFYATLGYTWTITDSTLMYFEAQTNDPDTTEDAETILRATYKLDF